jgi:hypothetical protein
LLKLIFVWAKFKKPVNGYQARVPFRWSWNEGWETSMFLIPLRQPGKPVFTTKTKTNLKAQFSTYKGVMIVSGSCYTIT